MLFSFLATPEDTRVYFELDTGRNRHIEFIHGAAVWREDIEKFIITPEYDYDTNYYWAESLGDFQTDTLKVAILIESLNAAGETAEDRKFAFRKSMFYGSSVFEEFESFYCKC